ncbi:type VII secretion target [Streptomyces halstedii]|uniref:type VII secretion target n=1 Tax=Streptomyces halstedii TaxID=1944 RepID=UPI0037D7F444
MSFDEEWAQLKEAALARRSTQMRLNEAGAGPGAGPGRKLHVTPAVLRARAGIAEDKAAKEFHDAHSTAVARTSEVSGSMKGFASDEALTAFVDSWKKGVRRVTGLIGNEGLAKNLRSAADTFETDDTDGEKNLGSVPVYKPGDVI